MMRKLRTLLCTTIAILLILAVSLTAFSANTFTFKGQTFQVPKGWPSEAEMNSMEELSRTTGLLIEYAYAKKDGPGFIIYWFIGTEMDCFPFITQILTKTWFISGVGATKCLHWRVNPDGTITQISCDEFNRTIEQMQGQST